MNFEIRNGDVYSDLPATSSFISTGDKSLPSLRCSKRQATSGEDSPSGINATHVVMSDSTRRPQNSSSGGRSMKARATNTAGRVYLADKCRRQKTGSIRPEECRVIKDLFRILPDDATDVLEPFSGSGAGGIAALSLGYNYTGIEQSEEFVAMSRERLTNALKVYETTGTLVDDVNNQRELLFV